MLKSLSLAELLRYGLSGAIFIAALMSAKLGVTGAFRNRSWPDVAILAALALVAGCFFYSVHRILYRFITPILQKVRSKKYPIEQLPTDKPFLENEYRRDFERWKRRCTSSRFQANLDLWAAHVHFLYCSAWAAAAGVIVGRVILLRSAAPGVLLCDDRAWLSAVGFLCFSVLCLLAAIVQDYVLTYYDRRLIIDATLVPQDPKNPGAAEKGEEHP